MTNQDDASLPGSGDELPEPQPHNVPQPEEQFADEMLSDAAMPETMSPEVLPPEAQLSTVISPETAPLPAGSCATKAISAESSERLFTTGSANRCLKSFASSCCRSLRAF